MPRYATTVEFFSDATCTGALQDRQPQTACTNFFKSEETGSAFFPNIENQCLLYKTISSGQCEAQTCVNGIESQGVTIIAKTFGYQKVTCSAPTRIPESVWGMHAYHFLT